MYQGEGSNSKKNKSSSSHNPSGSKQEASGPQAGPPKTPYSPFCFADGHWQRNCSRFKAWLAKKGNTNSEEISNVDESLYTEFSLNTWWVD